MAVTLEEENARLRRELELVKAGWRTQARVRDKQLSKVTRERGEARVDAAAAAHAIGAAIREGVSPDVAAILTAARARLAEPQAPEAPQSEDIAYLRRKIQEVTGERDRALDLADRWRDADIELTLSQAHARESETRTAMLQADALLAQAPAWGGEQTVARIASATEIHGSFSIEWNGQRAGCADVEDEISDWPASYAFENEDERARSIKENTMVRLQWYRRTSVSFYVFAAPDLASLFAWLNRFLDEERDARGKGDE